MYHVVTLLAIAGFALFADEHLLSTDSATAARKENVARDDKAAAQNPSADTKPGAPKGKQRDKRVLLITAADSERCAEELARLRRPGGDFEQMRARGWKIGPGPENHLQVVDREAVPELLSQLGVRDYPAVACLEKGAIIRSFREGCTTPLDMWTFGWLAKGLDERPPGAVLESARVESTGHFPLRGNHWSIDGDSNPSREKLIRHLHGSFHGSQLSPSWEIDGWSYEELRSLHDHLHERYGGGVVRSSRSSSASRNANQFSAGRKVTGR